MRRGLNVAVAIIALVALMGAESKSCSGQNEDVRSNRPANERQPGLGAFSVGITAFIGDERGLPATVIVTVRDPKGGFDTIDDVITQTERKWRWKVRYDPGVRLTIDVEVKPARAGTGAACEVYDGTNTTIHGPVWDSWRAMCHLVTAR